MPERGSFPQGHRFRCMMMMIMMIRGWATWGDDHERCDVHDHGATKRIESVKNFVPSSVENNHGGLSDCGFDRDIVMVDESVHLGACRCHEHDVSQVHHDHGCDDADESACGTQPFSSSYSRGDTGGLPARRDRQTIAKWSTF